MSASRLDAALNLMGALVLEDGRRWGAAAQDFQWEDARAVLDPESETPYSFLTRGRGGAKTGDLAGIAVAAMLEQAPAGARLYGLAADRDQGRLLLDSITGYRDRTHALRGKLDIGGWRVAVPRRNVTLEILAADAPGAWGLRPYLTIIDELAQWPTTPGARTLFEAVTSAAAKIPAARMVCLTSAGDPAHWSHKVREHAREDDLWRLHEVPGPAPWLDEKRLAEQRRRLPESSYRRLFLNEWTAAEDRLTSIDDLRACVTLDGPLAPDERWRYVVALDLGITNDRTVACVAHAEPIVVRTAEERLAWGRLVNEQVTGHRIVLDRIEVWQGSRKAPVQLDGVEEWIDTSARSYGRARVVVDPYQAVGMAQRLRSRGLQVTEHHFGQASNGRLASTLHLLLRNRALALPDDPDLLDELLNVRLRETTPGVMRMDHDPDKHDDRAITLALAAVHLLERPAAGVLRVVKGPRF